MDFMQKVFLRCFIPLKVLKKNTTFKECALLRTNRMMSKQSS
jgi:hypothetical protein